MNSHRRLVRRYCFRAGLYSQGLRHDLSKYSPTEFLAGVRYYQGDRSPNDIQRRHYGYSAAWLHHQGRNRHHFEYWRDYMPEKGRGVTGPVPMPKRYIAEMFCDRLAACHIYGKEKYTQSMPLDYFNRSKDRMSIHPATKRDLGLLLSICAERGEDAALRYIRDEYLTKEDRKRNTPPAEDGPGEDREYAPGSKGDGHENSGTV